MEEAISSAISLEKQATGLNPILRALLEGVYDDCSPLSSLRGTPHITRNIWMHLTEYWKSFIKLSQNKSSKVWPPTPPNMTPGSEEYVPMEKFVMELKEIVFPPSSNININMMPFILETHFEKCRLPENMRSYHKNLILPMLYGYVGLDKEIGKVCYLTIHESYVESNQTQRRPGLHTDNPGKIFMEKFDGFSSTNKRFKSLEGNGSPFVRFYEHHWGIGVNIRRDYAEGGIYMASNVENSCAVWNAKIECDSKNDDAEIIGKHGDIEHLRHCIGKEEIMKPNRIYWITDRTPHESLPMTKDSLRQYFRLVTHQVSLWFEDHSTKNPLGLSPDSTFTKIVKGSKFGNDLKIVPHYKYIS